MSPTRSMVRWMTPSAKKSSSFTDDSFRAKMADAVREFAKKDWSEEDWKAFAVRLFYVATTRARDALILSSGAGLAGSLSRSRSRRVSS